MAKFIDITGKRFGSLRAIKLDRRVRGKELRWIVKCECGAIGSVIGGHLRSGKTTRCKKCKYKKVMATNGRMPANVYHRMLERARLKGIKVGKGVTKKYLIGLFDAQNKKCALSGLEIKFAANGYGNTHGETTASLDRIDSNKGYVKGNVQWVHKDINYIKMNLSEREFIKLCKKVSEKNMASGK